MCCELSREQYDERNGIDGAHIDRRAEREISEVANYDEGAKRGQTDSNQLDRNLRGTSTIFGQAFREELRNEAGGSISGATGNNRRTTMTATRNDGDIQSQPRTKTLSDHEVLEMATDEVLINDFTDAEKDAFDIFKKRLVRLRQIQRNRMAKYGGKFDEAQRMDYTFAHDNLYEFENLDETSFGVIDRLDPAKQPEKADYIMEVFKDGVIGDVQDYRRRIKDWRSFQKLRSVHFLDAENRGAGAGNVELDANGELSSERNRLSGESSSNNDDLNTQSQPHTKTLSAAEVKALASGSPLIMEQVQLDTDIKKLESLRRAHTSAVRAAKERLEADKGTIATLEKRIVAGKAHCGAFL